MRNIMKSHLDTQEDKELIFYSMPLTYNEHLLLVSYKSSNQMLQIFIASDSFNHLMKNLLHFLYNNHCWNIWIKQTVSSSEIRERVESQETLGQKLKSRNYSIGDQKLCQVTTSLCSYYAQLSAHQHFSTTITRITYSLRVKTILARIPFPQQFKEPQM